MKRIVISLLAMVFLLVLVLPVAATGAGEKKAKEGEPVEIEYWDFIDPTQDNPRAKGLAQNIARFEELNPNIKINLQVVGFGAMVQNLPQAAAARQGPDVVKMFNPMLQLMIEAGVYQPLDPFIGDLPKDDWLLPWETSVFDGKKMVLPYEFRALTLIYREEHLKSVGAEVPKTWAELTDTSAKLTAKGLTGFATGFSTSDNASILTETFDAVMFQVDQPVFDKGFNLAFNTKKGLAFFQIMKNLQNKGALSPAVVEGNYAAAQDGIINGTAAMIPLGSHRIRVSQAAGGETVKWAPFPVVKGGKNVTVTTGWTFGMGAFTKHPQEAWQFIKYIAADNKAQVFLASGGEVPSRRSSFKDPYFSTADGQLLIDLSKYINSSGNSRIYPPTWARLGQDLARGMQSMYLEKLSAEQTMDKVVKEFNSK